MSILIMSLRKAKEKGKNEQRGFAGIPILRNPGNQGPFCEISPKKDLEP